MADYQLNYSGDEINDAIGKAFSALQAVPYNLLDNSDFKNPINQRGKTSYSGSGYTIDRWRTWSDSAAVQVISGGVKITVAAQQYVEKGDPNETHTLAVCDASGNVYTLVGIPANSPTGDKCFMCVSTKGHVTAGIHAGTWVWAALYEGEYTEETLPEYFPKGYATEMSECRRYYYALTQADCTLIGTMMSASMVRFIIPIPMPMRVAPTATLGGMTWLRQNGVSATPTDVSVASLYARYGQIDLNVNVTVNGFAQHNLCFAGLSGELSFSADL